MTLDVCEATRQLQRDRTAIAQRGTTGELFFLRHVTEHEAVGEPLHGGGETRTYRVSDIKLVTGYDSDEDGLRGDERVASAKRQRTGADSSSNALTDKSSTAAAADQDATAVFKMLCKRFPHVGPYGTDELERKLRLLEKYELVCQGDDHTDREYRATNSEALAYARARAVVKGLTWSLHESLESRGRQGTIERLMAEPFLGESSATKIVDILKKGTCERTLARFERGDPPLDKDGRVRLSAHKLAAPGTSKRLMKDAHLKLKLSEVLGISAIKAGELVDDPTDPVRSVDGLLARPDVVAKLPRAHVVQHSLQAHEQLKEAVPSEDAHEMRATVEAAVRALPIPRAGGWHAEFVGGARTRGKAGHDVDILLWHADEMASFVASDDEGRPLYPSVLKLLLVELVRRGFVLPKSEAFFHERYCGNQRHTTPRSYLASPHMANETSKGYENLEHDHHDKFFGIWRSARTQRLHRVDIVVCSHPEELPFARLGWTGTRTLNRLMRLRAIDLGLYLGAHCLVARGDRALTEVVLEARPGRQRETVTLRKLEPLPFKYVRSEEDILRVLACGTDDFIHLVEPTNRNA